MSHAVGTKLGWRITHAEEDRGHDSLCWIWQGCLSPLGYGILKRDGFNFAHRWYWHERHGPVESGQELHHRCRVPACVNPDHLELVTPAEHRQQDPRTRLTADDVREIRASPLGCRRLGKKYGVSRFTIMAARRRQSWKNVP